MEVVVRFIQEFGYTVKVGKDEAHQRWLAENDAALKAAMPEGMTYIGTFAVIFSSEKNAGSYKALFGLDSYGAMDAGAAVNKDPVAPTAYSPATSASSSISIVRRAGATAC